MADSKAGGSISKAFSKVAGSISKAADSKVADSISIAADSKAADNKAAASNSKATDSKPADSKPADDEKNQQIKSAQQKKKPVKSSEDERKEKLLIQLITWNTNTQAPPTNLIELLYTKSKWLSEILVIGLQEVGWADWEAAFSSALKKTDYVKIKVRKLQGIQIFLFVRRNSLQFVLNMESEMVKTGFGGYWGNKGGVSVRMDFMGMNLVVVNSHLAAHMNEVQERIQNINQILDSHKFRDPDTDNILDHDYVFWIGDLNFRIEDLTHAQVMQRIQDGDYDTLIGNDQLRKLMAEGLVFDRFREADPRFPPTYKFEVGTDTYNDVRIPSYTDRVLCHYHSTIYGNVKVLAELLEYTSFQNFRISDHKPVTAVFSFNVLSRGILPPITFKLPSEVWNPKNDQEVSYRVRKDYETQSGDWVGLFKDDFQDLNSYVMYAVANTGKGLFGGKPKNSIKFYSYQLVTLKTGYYYLCYMTKKLSLCAVSQKFAIGLEYQTSTSAGKS